VVIIGAGMRGHSAALHAVEVGVLKPQVDVTSINDFINPNVGVRGASNPFATFFHNVNPVPEAPASVDAQDATPTAKQVSVV
jgi:glycine/D-amino acid oxidase-like deaminating enzyme